MHQDSRVGGGEGSRKNLESNDFLGGFLGPFLGLCGRVDPYYYLRDLISKVMFEGSLNLTSDCE